MKGRERGREARRLGTYHSRQNFMVLMAAAAAAGLDSRSAASSSSWPWSESMDR